MMKYYVAFFLLFVLACNNNKHPQIDIVPDKEELLGIVEAVIRQDSLSVIRPDSQFVASGDSTARISYPLLRNLRKLEVTVPEIPRHKGMMIIPPAADAVSIFDLLGNFGLIKKNASGEGSFSKLDYQYLLSQNSVMKELILENTSPARLNLIAKPTSIQSYKNKMPGRYYELSIPILSPDRQNAYIEITFVCGGLCSSSKAVCLEKKQGKWVITKRFELWTA